MKNEFILQFMPPYSMSILTVLMDYNSGRVGWRLTVRIESYFEDQIYALCKAAGMRYKPDERCYMCGDTDLSDIGHYNWPSGEKKVGMNQGYFLGTERELLSLFNRERGLCIYTGAGISRAAGVWDANQLEENLMLTSLPDFLTKLITHPDWPRSVVSTFLRQLLNSTPTPAHRTIETLRRKFGCIVWTENRDKLHQKCGTPCIERQNFKRNSFLLKNKTLLVIGVSADHSDLIKLYRERNPNKGIAVIDKIVPSYISQGDIYFDLDVQFALPMLDHNTM